MRKLTLTLMMLLLLAFTGMAQQVINVKGQVKDKRDGSTLPGVTVMVVGKQTGTVTDINGNYSISVEGNAVLRFSFVGMKTQEISVNNRARIDVELEPAVSQLSEVVVVGYGSTKKMGPDRFGNHCKI